MCGAVAKSSRARPSSCASMRCNRICRTCGSPFGPASVTSSRTRPLGSVPVRHWGRPRMSAGSNSIAAPGTEETEVSATSGAASFRAALVIIKGAGLSVPGNNKTFPWARILPSGIADPPRMYRAAQDCGRPQAGVKTFSFSKKDRPCNRVARGRGMNSALASSGEARRFSGALRNLWPSMRIPAGRRVVDRGDRQRSLGRSPSGRDEVLSGSVSSCRCARSLAHAVEIACMRGGCRQNKVPNRTR